MKLQDYNSQEWEQLKNNTTLQLSEGEIDELSLKNILSVIRNENSRDIVSGPFGELIKTSPFTFAKSFNSENDVINEISLLKALREYFEQEHIKRDENFQYPKYLMGYFTFDNTNWYNLIKFERLMEGDTNESEYNGCLVNPTNYLEQLNEFDKKRLTNRSAEIRNELLKKINSSTTISDDINKHVIKIQN